MKKINIDRLSLFSLILFILAMVFLLPYMSSLGEELPASLDTNFFYSVADLKTAILLFNDSQAELYINIRWSYDILWPLVYTFFFVMLTIKFADSTSSKKSHWLFIILSFFPFVFDMMENTFITLILFSDIFKTNPFYLLAAISSSMKWISIFAVFIIIGYRVAINIIKNCKR